MDMGYKLSNKERFYEKYKEIFSKSTSNHKLSFDDDKQLEDTGRSHSYGQTTEVFKGEPNLQDFLKSPYFREQLEEGHNPFLKKQGGGGGGGQLSKDDSSENLLIEARKNASRKDLNNDPFIQRLNQLKNLYKNMKRDIKFDEDGETNFFNNIKKLDQIAAMQNINSATLLDSKDEQDQYEHNSE